MGLTKDDVGSVKFKDLNGDNKITTEDRTIIGNANPDFIFGIGNACCVFEVPSPLQESFTNAKAFPVLFELLGNSLEKFDVRLYSS